MTEKLIFYFYFPFRASLGPIEPCYARVERERRACYLKANGDLNCERWCDLDILLGRERCKQYWTWFGEHGWYNIPAKESYDANIYDDILTADDKSKFLCMKPFFIS